MSALPDTGSVVITVGVRPGSRRVLDVRSTRGPMVARLLRGRQADDRLASLVGLVYTLCPVSQASAWLTATDYARGEAPSGDALQARSQAVQLEILAEHLRFFAMDLPQLMGIAPAGNLRPLGAYRAQVSSLALRGDAALRQRLRDEAARLAGELLFGKPLGHAPKDAEDFAALTARLASGSTALASVFSSLQALPAGMGCNSVQTLCPDDAQVRDELARSLAEDDFCRAPRLASGPAQTTALARLCDAPAVRAAQDSFGRGCLLYAFARLLELRRFASAFADPQRLVRGFSPEPRVGISLVETARGTLMHRARLDAGNTVLEASIVAPTEWNFAPGGAAQQSLATVPESDPATWLGRVHLVARQFDACVPVRIEEVPDNA